MEHSLRPGHCLLVKQVPNTGKEHTAEGLAVGAELPQKRPVSSEEGACEDLVGLIVGRVESCEGFLELNLVGHGETGVIVDFLEELGVPAVAV